MLRMIETGVRHPSIRHLRRRDQRGRLALRSDVVAIGASSEPGAPRTAQACYRGRFPDPAAREKYRALKVFARKRAGTQILHLPRDKFTILALPGHFQLTGGKIGVLAGQAPEKRPHLRRTGMRNLQTGIVLIEIE